MFRGSTDEDERIVCSALQEMAATPLPPVPLPDPSFIWWKAQLLRRREAEREALAPIEVGERFHIGAALLGAAALAAGAWQYLPSIAVTPARAVGLGLGALVVLSVVALAVLDTLREA